MLHPSLVLSQDDQSTPNESSSKFVDVDEIIKQFAAYGEADNGTYAQSVLNNLSIKEDEECPICMDVMQEPVLIPACAHKGYDLLPHTTSPPLTHNISQAARIASWLRWLVRGRRARRARAQSVVKGL